MPPQDSFTHIVSEYGVGMSFEKNGFLVLNSLSEVVEGGGAFRRMR